MFENDLYAAPRDQRVHDGVRKFCLIERVDEEELRASIRQSIRAAKQPAVKPKKRMTSAAAVEVEENEIRA